MVVSGHPDEPSEIAALDAGADDYLGKPCSTERLLARVRVALRQKATRQKPRPSALACSTSTSMTDACTFTDSRCVSRQRNSISSSSWPDTRTGCSRTGCCSPRCGARPVPHNLNTCAFSWDSCGRSWRRTRRIPVTSSRNRGSGTASIRTGRHNERSRPDDHSARIPGAGVLRIRCSRGPRRPGREELGSAETIQPFGGVAGPACLTERRTNRGDRVRSPPGRGPRQHRRRAGSATQPGVWRHYRPGWLHRDERPRCGRSLARTGHPAAACLERNAGALAAERSRSDTGREDHRRGQRGRPRAPQSRRDWTCGHAARGL